MSGEEAIERELKFAEVELDPLRDRLQDLEAERVGPASFEDNLLFDRDGEVESAGCVLRLRTENHGARLTFKGPESFEGRVKVRREHEVRIDDAGEIQALFECLGFKPVRRYQKLREEWRLGGVLIALDHTPIGDFAEFEGPGAETVARRCGLDLDASERRNYLRLYDDFRKENPQAPPDMVFPEGKPSR